VARSLQEEGVGEWEAALMERRAATRRRWWWGTRTTPTKSLTTRTRCLERGCVELTQV